MRDINDAIAEWHTSEAESSLHDHLGMTWEEYARWVEGKMSTEELARFGYEDR